MSLADERKILAGARALLERVHGIPNNTVCDPRVTAVTLNQAHYVVVHPAVLTELATWLCAAAEHARYYSDGLTQHALRCASAALGEISDEDPR